MEATATAIVTRKNETRFTTRLVQEMFGRYLAAPLRKEWVEEFVDTSNGETVQIQQSELIMSAGTKVDQDIAAKIRFYLETGEIDQVEVSNQQREAIMVNYGGLTIWEAKIMFHGKTSKNKKILLYANSIHMGIEVVRDFVELNFTEQFTITGMKEYTNSIILKNNLRPVDEIEPENDDDETTADDLKFYKIEVRVTRANGTSTQTFIVHTKNVDNAMLNINIWLSKEIERRAKEDGDDDVSFETALESAVTIPVSYTIEKEFSKAYIND